MQNSTGSKLCEAGVDGHYENSRDISIPIDEKIPDGRLGKFRDSTLSCRVDSATDFRASACVSPQQNTIAKIFRRFSRTFTASIVSVPASAKLEPTSHEQFDHDHGYQLHQDQSVFERTKLFLAHHRCSQNCFIKFLLSLFPFVKTLRDYNPRTDLLRDFIAGLTVCVMHIPQGMAYGLLAGLAPVYGLYSSFFPVAIYCFFGTSRHISFGTMAVISLMVSSAITGLLENGSLPSFVTVVGAYESSSSASNSTDNLSIITTTQAASTSGSESATTSSGFSSSCISGNSEPLSDTDIVKLGGQLMPVSELRVEIAIAVTLLTGLIQIGLSILRLGFLTIYLSEPLINGFTTASSIYVATSQLSPIFGYSVPSYSGPLNLVYTYVALFSRIQKFNAISFGIAAACAIILSVFKEKIQPLINKRVKFPVPIDLVLIVVCTVISYLAQLKSYGVMIIGSVPPGIPPPRVPDVRFFPAIFQDCLLIAVIAYTITFSMASILARKHAYEVRGNQEMLANGLSNAASAFFNCHATTTSLSRSVVQEAAGAKSQVAALISCVGILLVLLFLAPLFQCVPRCVLSAIIIVALKNMFLQFTELPKLWRTSKYDFAIWVATFVATVLLDVGYGLICGFVFSIFTIMLRTQAPHTCELGRVRHTTLYKNVHMYDDIVKLPGIKVIRFDGALYFASKDHLRKSVARRTGVNAAKELRRRQRHRQPVHAHSDSTQAQHESDRNRTRSELEAIEVENASTGDREYSANLQRRRGSEEREVRLTHIILDCSSITFIDTAGVQALSQIVDEYAAIEVRVLLAGPHAYFRGMLEKMEFYEKHARESVLVTTHDAVLAALKEREVPPEEAVDFGFSLAGVLREGCEPDATGTDAVMNNNSDQDNAVTVKLPGLAEAKSPADQGQLELRVDLKAGRWQSADPLAEPRFRSNLSLGTEPNRKE